MKILKNSSIGIDLGHHTIKVVQMERQGDGWRVGRYATCDTPLDTIKDGVVVDYKTLGARLKQLLKESRIGATSAHIAAAGAAIFVRPVAFPKMSEVQLKKTIRFEASRYIPGSVDDSLIAFEILGQINETTMNVLIVAAPKEIVNSRLQACAEAGLDVESVDIESFAIVRSLVESNPEAATTGTMALVDIGSVASTVSVLHNGSFLMTRTLPYGGQTLTDSLKNYFTLALEDAEAGKSQLDLTELLVEPAPQENPPLRVIQPHVDDLIREIRRSLNYFQSQPVEGGGSRKIEALQITGGGAKLTGMATYMTDRLGIPVSTCGILDNARFSAEDPELNSGLDLGVASGLAMRAYAKAA